MRHRCRLRSCGGVHRGGGVIGPRKRPDQRLVRPIVDVDEAEIVILAVRPSARRVVGILEPVGSDDLRHGSEVDRRGGGTARALGLRCDRHQGTVIVVTAAILPGGEEPLRDQHRLAAGELAQAVEEITRDPAVGAVDIVVHRDDVDVARHRAHRDGIVVDRQAVAEEQGVGIGRAQHPLDHRVVVLGDRSGEAPHRQDAVAARPQLGGSLGGKQRVPRGDAVRRHEIGNEFFPRAAVAVAQQLDPALFGVIACRFRRIEDEERAAPPADLVVAEIADPVGAAFVGRDQLGGERAHRLLGGGIEGIEPMEAGEAAKLEIGDLGELQGARRQRPRASGIETP